jgi:hypothetical protein
VGDQAAPKRQPAGAALGRCDVQAEDLPGLVSVAPVAITLHPPDRYRQQVRGAHHGHQRLFAYADA